jgi:hypothetical protein
MNVPSSGPGGGFSFLVNHITVINSSLTDLQKSCNRSREGTRSKFLFAFHALPPGAIPGHLLGGAAAGDEKARSARQHSHRRYRARLRQFRRGPQGRSGDHPLRAQWLLGEGNSEVPTWVSTLRPSASNGGAIW